MSFPAIASMIAGWATLMLVVGTHAVIIARWSGRMSTVIEHHEVALAELKKIVERHDKRIFDLEVKSRVEEQVREELHRYGLVKSRKEDAEARSEVA